MIVFVKWFRLDYNFIIKGVKAFGFGIRQHDHGSGFQLNIETLSKGKAFFYGTEKSMENMKWTSTSVDEILKEVDLKNGLSTQVAQQKLKTEGYNKLKEAAKKSWLMKFIDQFKDVMIIILLIAAVISASLGEVIDALIILAIVIVNALLGLYQEGKAENALEALQKLSAPNSKVIRDGKEISIPSQEIVKGDIVVLEAGDLINADLRLLKTSSLKVEEASLTGESVPVEKDAMAIIDEDKALGDRINMAYSSGNVTYGRGLGVVVATGMETEVGKIASILNETKNEQTPLQKQLDKLGRLLGIVAIVAVAGIFILGLINGKDAFAMFLTSISLAVAVIPESLPTVSTLVLSLGVQRLVKKNAIVKTLPSVETLGSTTVICSDKTGTLTQNKMTVVEYFNDQREDLKDELARAMFLCNDSRLNQNQEWVGDPTETALSDWAVQQGLNYQETLDNYPRIAEVPFDSGRKRMTTVNLIDNQQVVFVKGGVDEVLACTTRYGLDPNGIRTITTQDIDKIKEANQAMGQKALRVLAVGYKMVEGPIKDGDFNLESDLIFLGLLGMIDPPREEVKDSIRECKNAGIRAVMITGDHATTAQAIGREIGLLEAGQKVITGVELDQMSDDELFQEVKNIGVYARVSPEHKMRIIDAWKKHGNIVAMTGDGVNDAPALKKADIGAAMGIVGTEVAKGASDMVLTDDNFATVVNAVEEGRRIKDNIKKAIGYLLSCNLGELFTLLVSTLANWATPLLAIHILWINLVTDSLPALALGVDPAESDIMNRQPDRSNTLFTKPMAWRVLYQGIMIGVLTTFGYIIGRGWVFGLNGSVELGQTMAFSVLGFSQLAHSLNIHSPHESVFQTMLKNKSLIQAICINILMMLAVLLIPAFRSTFKLVEMDLAHWGYIILLSILPWLIVEILKLLKLNGND